MLSGLKTHLVRYPQSRVSNTVGKIALSILVSFPLYILLTADGVGSCATGLRNALPGDIIPAPKPIVSPMKQGTTLITKRTFWSEVRAKGVASSGYNQTKFGLAMSRIPSNMAFQFCSCDGGEEITS